MTKKILITLCVLFLLASITASAKIQVDSGEYKIRLNQIGFYPNAEKIAIVVTDKAADFFLQTPKGKVVFNGKLKRSEQPGFGGKFTYAANFSVFNKAGLYTIKVSGVGNSYPFIIDNSVHRKVGEASVKAFYFIRASIPLEEQYAGKWKRAEGHPDNKVLIHPSAISKERPEGTIISSPGGWYDAGDYNKYIVNSGISTYTLLSLYEDFPDYMRTVKLNIPESDNGLPDILNESLWNLRWMLTMQDLDGGVYHKLTNAVFDEMAMPDKATTPRYVVQKSTAATLDFAAVMAQANRIFKQFPGQLPGLADSCINASKKAWEWALKNPEVIYKQNEINKKYQPKITTGEYGDGNVKDEFIWAASELFVTTKDTQYVKRINIFPDNKMELPSWNNVRMLGYYSILRNSKSLENSGVSGLTELKQNFLAFADDLIKDADKTAYQSIMYKSKRNFEWGSNSVAANQGMALIQAYQLSHDAKYLKYALANLDYILGRNGTGYCYVTGYGSKSTMHPHHRPSVADHVVEPVPGLMAGGPNPGMQDHIKVPSIIPDEAYIDDDRAYAVNEIAINWNAPLAYLANALEALQKSIK